MSRQSVMYKTGKGGKGTRIVKASQAVKAARATLLAARRNTAMYGGGGFNVMSKPIPFYRQSELKCVDTPTTNALCSTTAVFTAVNIPVQGAAVYNRVGNEIEMKSLHLIGQFDPTANSNASSEYLRIMVVYDRQTNGAFPTIADLLTSYDQAGATYSTVLDHLNPNNFDRFKVLCDIRLPISLDASTAPAAKSQFTHDYNNEFNVNRFINLRGMGTKYKASAGAVGDIASGGLYVVVYGDTAAATAAYTFQFTARLRFVD